MSGLALIEPTELYNLLNQGLTYPCVSDPCYLLLLDARDKVEYIESHIITAKRAPKSENGQFIAPHNGELECKQNIVVYDGNSSNLNEIDNVKQVINFLRQVNDIVRQLQITDFLNAVLIPLGTLGVAHACANVLWQMGSKNPVRILQGGYEVFSALYPFLRTQKVIYMPRELDDIQTYPTEIIPGLLYLGNWRHGNMPYIQKDVKIKAHINCCLEQGTFKALLTSQKSQLYKILALIDLILCNEYMIIQESQCASLLHVPVDDLPETDLHSHFSSACALIEKSRETGTVVLVFSQRGISRSATIVIAYLMTSNKCTLKAAYEHVLKYNTYVRPNQGFLKQLLRWESEILGQKLTNIELLAI